MANEYTYRADHIGKLTLPPDLVEARARHARGELDAAGLRKAEDAAIAAIQPMQRGVGMLVASDGQYRRANGVKLTGDALSKNEALFLKANARLPVKVSVPAARANVNSTDVVKREIEALVAAGVDYVQLEATDYAALLNDQGRAALKGQGVDADKKLDELIGLDKAALAGIQRANHVRFAVRIGHDNGRAISTTPACEKAIERLFNELPAERFLISFGDKDSFAPLRLLPQGKVVVLGLVDPLVQQDTEKLLARIDDAAKVTDVDNLALSTTDGFPDSAPAGEAWDGYIRRKLDQVGDLSIRCWGFAI
jgi:5-methyltetrahydropteroyltriglutamate--homocysteine methyltransferase